MKKGLYKIYTRVLEIVILFLIPIILTQLEHFSKINKIMKILSI
jgi:hypothetical protein